MFGGGGKCKIKEGDKSGQDKGGDLKGRWREGN